MSSNALRASSRRITISNHTSFSYNLQQTRNATLIKRPKRPYTFTQLVMLTDGSAFVHRTTSPQPVYRSNKDILNVALWNPSSKRLLNVEDDEAGKLSAFRSRFGRNWDSTTKVAEEETSTAKQDEPEVKTKATEQANNQSADGHDHLIDLISESAASLPVLKGIVKPQRKK